MSVIPRLLISAAHKSSGKTVFTTGLCAELVYRGYDVRPFKKGPDYIDPQWLALATQANCYNLDFNTQTPDEMVGMFIGKCESEKVGGLLTTTLQASFTAPGTHSNAGHQRLFKCRGEFQRDGRDDNNGTIAIIEANKGLYDGVSTDGTDSNAALAKLLSIPVILVIDCEGMTRGIAPLLCGYLNFDPDVPIAGVVLNKVGGARHADKLKAAVAQYTNVPVVGCVMRDERMTLPERHLGLIPSSEYQKASERIEAMRQVGSENVNIEEILTIAHSASEIEIDDRELARLRETAVLTTEKKINLGIFLDSAFSFYYPDDLESLENIGFSLVPINALYDTSLPDVAAIFIGGGFPETQAGALQSNSSLRAEIKDAIEAGLPAYAECGGLMYLSRSIEWHGKRHEMVGVIQADTVMRERPCGRGYVQIEETADMLWPSVNSAKPIYGAHEFHYSKLVNLSPDENTAYTMLRGTGVGNGRDGIVYKNLLASFVHLRASNSGWTKRFKALHDMVSQ